MFSHITIGTSKLTRAMAFYDAVMAPLGWKRTRAFKIAASYAPEGYSGLNEPFWIVRRSDGEAASARNGVTVASDAATRPAVDKSHAAARAARSLRQVPRYQRARLTSRI